jgi:hypothetical protein
LPEKLEIIIAATMTSALKPTIAKIQLRREEIAVLIIHSALEHSLFFIIACKLLDAERTTTSAPRTRRKIRRIPMQARRFAVATANSLKLDLVEDSYLFIDKFANEPVAHIASFTNLAIPSDTNAVHHKIQIIHIGDSKSFLT